MSVQNISLDIYYTRKTRIKQISAFSTLLKLEKMMSSKSNLKKGFTDFVEEGMRARRGLRPGFQFGDVWTW